MVRVWRNRALLVLVAIALLVGLAGCRAKEKAAGAGEVPVEYATGFKIERLEGGGYLLTDGGGRTLLLLPRGQQSPKEYEQLPRVEIPVERVVVASTTQAALLRPLGELASVVGVATEKEHWYIPEIREGMEAGKIRLVGSGMGPLDYEAVLALKPDLVFLYTGSPDTVQMLKKLEELKIPVAVENSHLEAHPLGRLEWIKFLAAFYGKLAAAEQYFEAAVKQAEEIQQAVAGVGSRPKVLWGLIYQGKVYVPAGESYVARMIEMAGGDYLFKDLQGTGSSTVTLEEFYSRGREAQVFISATMPNYGITSIAKLVEQEKRLGDLSVVREGKVWCFQPWYYQSLDKIVEMIADLAAIFHPEVFPKAEIRHHMKLPASD